MTVTVGTDTAKTRKTLTVGGTSIDYYSIAAAEAAGLGNFSKLPAALKVVLENLLRFEDGGFSVSTDDIKAFSEWADKGGKNPREIAYRPARVLMQDFTGVPAVVDLAAMRDGIVALGGDAQQINPLNPVDLVIDHSVMIDEFGNPRAFQKPSGPTRTRMGSKSPILTLWSAQTATPQWSTVWLFWAGASAGSRLRPRCWASQSPC